MTRPQPRYKPGDRIGGRYQVHQVKMGGMGEVYLCLDLETIQPYALKTFQQRYQSAALRKAFEQEVATWVALEKHPNIVRCFHMDILDNRPFMVLEWIAGEEGKGADLRGWLRHGPLELRTALDIIIDVVRGLLHAQEKQLGIVHRDLKPENILVAQGPVAKITDFGLAQIVEQAGLEIAEGSGDSGGRHSLLGQGGLVGTPAYMAPEQWRGEKLDERTDIYAVGCILYELLSGEWPFRVDFTPNTAQGYRQWLTALRAEHERGEPAILPATVPSRVRELVQSSLAKAPDKRPGGPGELLAWLEVLYQEQFGASVRAILGAAEMTSLDYNNRGVTYANLKRHGAALTDYNWAITLDPDDATAYNNRGNTFADLQQYEAALADFSRAIEVDPDLAKAYSNRGSTYTALQQYEAALTDHNRAIELEPACAGAYYNRGLAYHNLQQYEVALADYGRAIELDPGDVKVYSNRGSTYHALQQYEAALADYSWAIDLEPRDAQAYYNRGNTYKALQQYEAALADFGRAIELDLGDAQAYSSRGLAYHELMQYQAALADYGQAIGLDLEDATVYYNRGNTYTALQQYEAALSDYNRAIELEPGLAKAYSNRGNTYTALQQYEAALTDYNRAIELDPSDSKTYSNRGTIYQTLEQYEKALADYSRAIELDPGLAKAYSNRGAIYQALEQYETALVDYGRAIELDPDEALAYLNLGVLFWNQGKHREALPYFEKAAQLDSSQGAQYAAMARHALGIVAEPQVDPAQQAFEAFQQAGSVEVMRQAVAQFPFIGQAGFIQTIKQVIAQQVPPEHRPYFERRLDWLRQIADEQNDSSQRAFEAFQHAASVEAMRHAVAHFPFMAQAGFIQVIEQAMAQQVPPEHRPYFEQRLGWLKQIAQEKKQ